MWIFRCCLYVKSTILCYDLASFPFEVHFVISRRGGLEGFVQHSVYSCWSWCFRDSITILYHFKTINWIGTHWRGTRRRSPVKGVNSVINFCLWLSSSFFCFFFYFSLVLLQFAFHFCFKHLISVNAILWSKQTDKRIFYKLLMHTSWGPTDQASLNWDLVSPTS